MEQTIRPVTLYNISVELPLQRIYTRLGFRKRTTSLTEAEADRIRHILDTGMLSVHLSGVYVRKSIKRCSADQIVLDGGTVWESQKLAALLSDAREVYILGATAGQEIITARDQYLEQGKTLNAVLIDALASEMVESAMQWLHDHVGKLLRKELKTVTKRRYSPGYGDFSLHHQREIVSLLQFEQLGVTLNQHYLLIPEKSVTAVVGIL
jgi:hypothetical protein